MSVENLPDLASQIKSARGGDVVEAETIHGQAVIRTQRENLLSLLSFLRDDPAYRFEQLIDICGVDYPDRPERFDVVYQLLSLTHNRRIRVKVSATEDAAVPSCAGVYKTAGWLEREVWDMYGIYFSGHADLRRILTDYGFEGHPQRKDFPLTGYVELRYDNELKRTVYSPVQLVQDFRRFDFMSPWEAMTDVQLPGDEKAVKPKFGWKKADLLSGSLADLKGDAK